MKSRPRRRRRLMDLPGRVLDVIASKMAPRNLARFGTTSRETRNIARRFAHPAIERVRAIVRDSILFAERVRQDGAYGNATYTPKPYTGEYPLMYLRRDGDIKTTVAVVRPSWHQPDFRVNIIMYVPLPSSKFLDVSYRLNLTHKTARESQSPRGQVFADSERQLIDAITWNARSVVRAAGFAF